ncbi:MAG: hypothetical protein PHD95_04390 [Candidatus ainarchaeum sp.]|nr:hypothetical protein [Candidatus ainarchaeum sp.]
MKNSAGIIIQARMGSSRLPGKSLMKIKGVPVLGIVVKRLQKCRAVRTIIVATTENKKDRAIIGYCKKNKIKFFAGSEQDVLGRFFECAKLFNLGTVVRITADCPLIDPKTVDEAVKLFDKGNYDYASNITERSFPRGLDVEVFSFNALRKAFEKAEDSFDREHVTHFMYGKKSGFRLGSFSARGRLFRPELRFCVDTITDFELIKKIFSKFGFFVSVSRAIQFLDENPALLLQSAEEEEKYRQNTKKVRQGFANAKCAPGLRRVNNGDLKWIACLMNDPGIRRNSFSPKKITEEQNKRYWKRKLRSGKFAAFAIILGSSPVGLIRIDKKLVSIALEKKYRGRGIAFNSLKKLDLNGCFAEIKPENKESLGLFKKLGFSIQKIVLEKV